MKTIRETVDLTIYKSKMFDMYFGGKSFAVFDIETTGLSPVTSHVILSGILLNCNNSFESIQYFAENPSEESNLIKETFQVLSGLDYIITYNGRHFDISFLKERARRLHIPCPKLPFVLDLFLIVNGYLMSKELLPNMKQKTVEIFMELSDDRVDRISGADSVKLYETFVNTGSIDAARRILLHNHDDIIQLYKILPIIEKTDFHKAMYRLGYPAGAFVIKAIKISKMNLYIKGIQCDNPTQYISFPTEEKPYSLMKNVSDSTFEVTIPCERVANALVIDAAKILNVSTEQLKKYPFIANGYLILEHDGTANYLEINYFLLELSHLL